MFKIADNDIITLNRGDTVTIPFVINISSKQDIKKFRYAVKSADAIYFGIMLPHQYFEDAIIKKKYTIADMADDGSITILVSSGETAELEPGVYYYEIKMKSATGVKTLISKKKFIVGE